MKPTETRLLEHEKGESSFWPAAALVAVLAGCMSAPKLTDPTAPWTPQTEVRKADKVWLAVRGQSLDVSRPLTLMDLADIALRNSPATGRAWNDARAAAAAAEQAKGYFFPTVSGTLGGTRSGVSAEPETFDEAILQYGPGLQVNYLVLNLGGGREAAVQAALQSVYAANFTFNRSIQDVLLAVETAYYGQISAQAGVEAAVASVKDANTALEAAKVRLTQGTGTELDVLQAQTGYDLSLYNLAGAQGQLKIARGDLAQAVGLAADTALEVAAPTPDVPETLGPRDMRRLIDDSLRRRPDIAALRATAASREAAVKVVGSARWPSLYLNGALNRDYYDTLGGKQIQDRDWSYGLGLNLQWLLFDGLGTLNAKRIAEAQADSARSQLKQAELAAGADVWARYSSYETAVQKYRFSAAFLKSATASYGLALDSYKAGLKSILDLLGAESQLAQARSQSIAARQEVFTALAGLAYATGLLEKGGSQQVQGLFATSDWKDHQP